MLSLHGQMVKPDILISIYGLAPGYFSYFPMPKNILYGVDKRVHGSLGNSTASRILYFHDTV